MPDWPGCMWMTSDLPHTMTSTNRVWPHSCGMRSCSTRARRNKGVTGTVLLTPFGGCQGDGSRDTPPVSVVIACLNGRVTCVNINAVIIDTGGWKCTSALWHSLIPAGQEKKPHLCFLLFCRGQTLVALYPNIKLPSQAALG